MHFALLIGYGASAIYPYLAFDTVRDLFQKGKINGVAGIEKALYNYTKSINKGLLKVFSKMGISTLQSYQGAQIFEAVGLGESLIESYFTGTTSRLGGIGIEIVAREALLRHEYAFPNFAQDHEDLVIGGYYQWRRNGEFHMINPEMVAKLQHAVRIKSYETFKEYSGMVNQQTRRATIRGLLDFQWAPEPIPLDEVEPASVIVKRFVTGAMSFGSISKEAHENLAIAMARAARTLNASHRCPTATFGAAPSSRWRPAASA